MTVEGSLPTQPMPPVPRPSRRSRWIAYGVMFIMLIAWVALYGGEDHERWVRALLFHLAKALF